MRMRTEFNQMLLRYGHPVLYCRLDQRVRCTCAPMGQDPKPDCQRCLGTGYKIRLEKLLAITRSATVPETQPGLLRFEDPGIVHPDAYLYYLASNVRPHERDVIFECDWQGYTPLAPRGRYVISLAQPLYDQKEEIVCYKVVVRAEHKWGDAHWR